MKSSTSLEGAYDVRLIFQSFKCKNSSYSVRAKTWKILTVMVKMELRKEVNEMSSARGCVQSI